jgi:hypothetical protein
MIQHDDHYQKCFLAIVLIICVPLDDIGQQCPQTRATGPSVASEARALEGLLIFHNGIRKWFELKLDEPQCGQSSVELVSGKRSFAPRNESSLEVLRGCRVRSKGVIAFSPTGYYSLNTYQAVERIEPVGSCVQQPVFPDEPKTKPDHTVRKFRVDMYVDDGAGDHPIRMHVSSEGKELQPRQAYASYWLTGGFVLYGYCAEGFVVDKVFGTPQANPSHFNEPRTPADAAMFDPEGVTGSGKKQMHLVYTCVRKP